MMEKVKKTSENPAIENMLEEKAGSNLTPTGFVFESEDDRFLRDMSRSPIEKLQLFTKMIRRNRMLNRFQSK